jgi:dihydrofolate reductase
VLISIAAVAQNGAIGYENKIPWPRIKDDMLHFMLTTQNHAVVMGRKTCQSLKNPLKNRTNIVLSRNKKFDRNGFIVIDSPKKIIELGKISDVYIIGGEKIYEYFMPYVDQMIITRVFQSPKGDTFFPPFDMNEWELLKGLNSDGFCFEDYKRKKTDHRA